MIPSTPFKLPSPLLTLLIFIHFLSIILHGGEQDWEVVLIGSISFFSLSLALFGTDSTTTLNIIKQPLFLLFIYILFLFVYLITEHFPADRVSTWSGTDLFELQNFVKGNFQTISNSVTLNYILKSIIIFVIFVNSIIVLKNVKAARAFIYSFLGIALLFSAYSWLNYITEGSYEIVTAIPPWNTRWSFALSGTFSYKNHFATYLSVTMLLSLGLCIEAFISKDRIKQVLTTFITIVLFVTFLETNARGALLIFSVLASILLLQISVRTLQRKNVLSNILKKGNVVLLTIVIVASTFFVSQSSSLNRLKELGLNDSGRLDSYLVALDIVAHSPVSGSGPGTYALVRHLFKQPETISNSGMWDNVHNDYLQILATQGVIGFCLFFIPVFWLVKRALLIKSKDHHYLLLSSKLALITLLLHGMIDYSFSLFYFMVLMFTFIVLCFAIGNNEIVTNEYS